MDELGFQNNDTFGFLAVLIFWEIVSRKFRINPQCPFPDGAPSKLEKLDLMQLLDVSYRYEIQYY